MESIFCKQLHVQLKQNNVNVVVGWMCWLNCLTCLSGQVCVLHQAVMDQVMSMDDLRHIGGAVELNCVFARYIWKLSPLVDKHQLYLLTSKIQ